MARKSSRNLEKSAVPFPLSPRMQELLGLLILAIDNRTNSLPAASDENYTPETCGACHGTGYILVPLIGTDEEEEDFEKVDGPSGSPESDPPSSSSEAGPSNQIEGSSSTNEGASSLTDTSTSVVVSVAAQAAAIAAPTPTLTSIILTTSGGPAGTSAPAPVVAAPAPAPVVAAPAPAPIVAAPAPAPVIAAPAPAPVVAAPAPAPVVAAPAPAPVVAAPIAAPISGGTTGTAGGATAATSTAATAAAPTNVGAAAATATPVAGGTTAPVAGGTAAPANAAVGFQIPPPSVPIAGLLALSPNYPVPVPTDAVYADQGADRYYTVTRGLRVGVFAGWSSVSPYVTGIGSAVYTRYSTLQEAYNAYVTVYGQGLVRYN